MIKLTGMELDSMFSAEEFGKALLLKNISLTDHLFILNLLVINQLQRLSQIFFSTLLVFLPFAVSLNPANSAKCKRKLKHCIYFILLYYYPAPI